MNVIPNIAIFKSNGAVVITEILNNFNSTSILSQEFFSNPVLLLLIIHKLKNPLKSDARHSKEGILLKLLYRLHSM